MYSALESVQVSQKHLPLRPPLHNRKGMSKISIPLKSWTLRWGQGDKVLWKSVPLLGGQPLPKEYFLLRVLSCCLQFSATWHILAHAMLQDVSKYTISVFKYIIDTINPMVTMESPSTPPPCCKVNVNIIGYQKSRLFGCS